MKSLKKSFLVLLSIIFVFVACDQREFDTPPYDTPVADMESNMTVRQFKDSLNLRLQEKDSTWIEITEPYLIKGIITANDVSGNIYKQIQIQDTTAGICIAINQTNIWNDFRIGQEIILNCQGLYFGLYGGYPQIGELYEGNIGQMTWLSFTNHVGKKGFPDTEKVEIKEYTLEELSINSPCVGTVVTIKNVYFEMGGKEPFAVPGVDNKVQTESKILLSANSSATLIARNSSAANFASKIMPKGVGSVSGVLSTYTDRANNTTLQITFRDSLDCSPTRFGASKGDGSKEKPWSISHALENQTGNLSGWIEGYIVGAVAPGITDANPVRGNDNLSFAAPFLNNTVILAETDDVKDYTKVVVVNLPENSEIRTNVNLADHADNLGKKLKVTGKLANQFGIAGLIVTKGTSDEFVFDSSSTGEGTQENPYTVAQGITNQGSSSNTTQTWTKGYIVGAVNNGATTITGPGDYKIGVTSGWDSQTNVIIADSPTETNIDKCIIVNLPAGKSLRTQVNLVDNPGNYGKTLTVKGVLRTYFGKAGLRGSAGETADFILQ